MWRQPGGTSSRGHAVYQAAISGTGRPRGPDRRPLASLLDGRRGRDLRSSRPTACCARQHARHRAIPPGSWRPGARALVRGRLLIAVLVIRMVRALPVVHWSGRAGARRSIAVGRFVSSHRSISSWSAPGSSPDRRWSSCERGHPVRTPRSLTVVTPGRQRDREGRADVGRPRAGRGPYFRRSGHREGDT